MSIHWHEKAIYCRCTRKRSVRESYVPLLTRMLIESMGNIFVGFPLFCLSRVLQHTFFASDYTIFSACSSARSAACWDAVGTNSIHNQPFAEDLGRQLDRFVTVLEKTFKSFRMIDDKHQYERIQVISNVRIGHNLITYSARLRTID